MKARNIITALSIAVLIAFLSGLAIGLHQVLSNRYLQHGMHRMMAVTFQQAMNTWIVWAGMITIGVFLLVSVVTRLLLRRGKSKLVIAAVVSGLFCSYGVWAIHHFWLPRWFHPLALLGNGGVLILTVFLWRLLMNFDKGRSELVSGFLSSLAKRLHPGVIAGFLIAALAILNLAVSLDRTLNAPKNFNVVWILIDALRADHLGCYGYEKDTSPFIDSLATKGVRFTRAFSQESYTQASVPSYFTSTYPPSHKVLYDQPQIDVLDSRFITLAEILRNANFTTAGFVFNPHLKAKFNFNQGFDLYDDNKEGFDKSLPFYETFETARKILQKVKDYLSENNTRPLFLYLHYRDVHDPYAPPPPYDKIFLPPGVSAPVDLYRNQTPFTRQNLPLFTSQYDGDIKYTDDYLRKLIELLKSHNITFNNSIIIITADHGQEFLDPHPGDPGGPCHGRTLYQEQIRVPLILSLPGSIPVAEIIDSNVQLVDILPTILDLLGIGYKHYNQLQGRSLARVIQASARGSASPETGVVYSGGNHGRSVLIDGDWKYYCYDSYSKEKRERVFIRPPADYSYRFGEEIYNIKRDPGETINLIRQEEASARRLREDLRVLKETIFSEKLASSVNLDNETREELKSLGYVQ